MCSLPRRTYLDASLPIEGGQIERSSYGQWGSKDHPYQIIILFDLRALKFNGISIIDFLEIQFNGD